MPENASLRWKTWHGAFLARLSALVLLTRDVDCTEVVGILSIFLGVPFLGYVEVLFGFFLRFLLSAVL